ncbi:MAG: WD40/YVTN/BNR-like repeat-containing protein [Anaerolineae bacterium]
MKLIKFVRSRRGTAVLLILALFIAFVWSQVTAVTNTINPIQPEKLVAAATAVPQPALTATTPITPAHQSLPWVFTGGPIGGLGYDVRMQPDNPDIMYVTDAYAGVFKSTNGGMSWFPANNGITSRFGTSGDAIPVFSLTIDPNNPNRLWAGTQYASDVFRSDDAGTTWQLMKNGIQESQLTIRGFAVEPGNSNTVYLAGEISSWEWNGTPLPGLGLDMVKGAVYKTTNGGQNWTRIWLGDNLARYIWIHPTNHNRLYVSTGIFDREAANSNANTPDPGGVGILRSSDGGATWEILDENNGLNAEELYFGSLYMHPTNPDILLAAAGNDPYTVPMAKALGGVYRTEDGGDTWTEVLDGHTFSAVEFCRSNPNIAYAGARSGLFKSVDAGKTWTQLTGDLWGSADAVAGFPIDMQCDPSDPTRNFINNYGGGNFMSSDSGNTWSVASTGYSGALMAQIATYPNLPSIVYASARSGLFASYDGGAHWPGLAYGVARTVEGIAIAVDPGNPLHVLATLQDGGPDPKASDDGGRTWREIITGLWPTSQPRDGEMVTQIVFAPSNPQILYATTGTAVCYQSGECQSSVGKGVIISQDGGETWAQTGLSGGNVLGVAVSPQNSSLLFAGLHSGELYRSNNAGQTWQLVNSSILPSPPPDPGLPTPILKALAMDSINPNKLYAGFFYAGVAVSSDGGATWTNASAGMAPESSVVDFAVDGTNSGVIYAATTGSGVFVSLDGGGTWAAINDGLLTRWAMDLSLSADGGVLYVASNGGGVFRLGTPDLEDVYLPAIERN